MAQNVIECPFLANRLLLSSSTLSYVSLSSSWAVNPEMRDSHDWPSVRPTVVSDSSSALFFANVSITTFASRVESATLFKSVKGCVNANIYRVSQIRLTGENKRNMRKQAHGTFFLCNRLWTVGIRATTDQSSHCQLRRTEDSVDENDGSASFASRLLVISASTQRLGGCNERQKDRGMQISRRRRRRQDSSDMSLQ